MDENKAGDGGNEGDSSEQLNMDSALIPVRVEGNQNVGFQGYQNVGVPGYQNLGFPDYQNENFLEDPNFVFQEYGFRGNQNVGFQGNRNLGFQGNPNVGFQRDPNAGFQGYQDQQAAAVIPRIPAVNISGLLLQRYLEDQLLLVLEFVEERRNDEDTDRHDDLQRERGQSSRQADKGKSNLDEGKSPVFLT